MKKKIKVWIWPLLLVGFVGVGCQKGVLSGKVHLKVSSWGDVQENKILSDMIAEFQTQNPNIQVELQRIPFSEYVTKLLTQIAGGLAPDVIFVEVNNFVDLYLRGAFEPLNEYLPGSTVKLEDYYPQVVDRFTVDGQHFVIPRDTAPICVVYYNKKAFQEAGLTFPADDWDWNDFLAKSTKLVKKDAAGKVTRWAYVEDWPMTEPWVYSAGGALADDVKKPTKWVVAESQGWIEGIQFRADLMHKHKIMPPPSSLAAMGGLGTSDLFVNGTAAMFLSGIWKTPSFREQIKNFSWDVVMFPKHPSGRRAFGTGGSGYGILKSSKHKKEAWKLVQYLSGETGAIRLAQTGLAQPALMRVASSVQFLDGQDPKNKKMLLEAVQYTKYLPMAKNTAEVLNSIINPVLDKVWNGSWTAAQAAKELKPALEKNPPLLN